MADTHADPTTQLADLEARVRELEAVQALILRILSTTKPLDRVLEQYGATETQEQAFYALMDDLVARAGKGDQEHPTFGYFQMRLEQIFPALRHDRVFTQLIIDTLKLERPAYRPLYAYATEHDWPAWT
jgi:hypothetical protein